MALHISSNFDAGNIRTLDASNPNDIQLEINFDAGDEHMQWFHYRVHGGRGQALHMRLMNAGKASYVAGWKGYQACASYDRDHWFRVPTRYEDGELIIDHTPERDQVYYAYFAPYSFERHLDLVADASTHPEVVTERLGATLDGRDLDLLRVGEPKTADGKDKLPCGSSPDSTRGRPWPSGSWRDCSSVCSTTTTPWPWRCATRPCFTWCPT